jgi:alkylhydroperoxidase family enzyme
MTRLDEAWRTWRALNRTDRARFLTLFREVYAQEREMARRANGGGARGERVASLSNLRLSEADYERRRPLVRLPAAGLRGRSACVNAWASRASGRRPYLRCSFVQTARMRPSRL